MPSSAQINFIDQDFCIDELDHRLWQTAEVYSTQTLWSGEQASSSESFETRLLWSKNSLYVRFDAQRSQEQALNVNPEPNLDKKTMQLWERDVCEVFIATDSENTESYFEFEVAPTGEWIDLHISHQTNEHGERERVTDWGFQSNMQCCSKIEPTKIVSALKVNWSDLQAKPKKDDIMRGNFFRATGFEPERSYLAWLPTHTEEPNFHVPEKFVEIVFG